jgi:hypothetical protein
MTRKTILALLAQADATLPDNVDGLITPQHVRAMVKDIVESFSPGYGAASNPTITLSALGTTPRVIPYTTELAKTPEFEINLALGTIKRLALGLPTTVNRISFYADVNAASGSEIEFGLYRGGVLIPAGQTTITAQGAGNFAQAVINIGTTTLDGADYAYEVRASKISGAADNVQLNNARFICEIIPTIGI